MRVAVTGMGGDLGTRVALMLEADEDVEAVMGVDLEPPRRHLRRAEYHRVDPRDRDRMIETIAGFAPTVLVHLGVYEPHARSGPRSATTRTAVGTIAALDACLRAGTLDAVVVLEEQRTLLNQDHLGVLDGMQRDWSCACRLHRLVHSDGFACRENKGLDAATLSTVRGLS